MSGAQRVASVLSVADAAIWAELDAIVPLGPHTEEALDPLRRVMAPSFDREVLPELGDRVLVRYARRDAAEEAASRAHLADEVAALPARMRQVLVRAQRHALDGVVLGRHAWDPEEHAESVRALHGAGLLTSLGDEAPPYEGSYRLHPDLPPPVEVSYDFEEAVMDETDDLEEPSAGPVGLLHDMASLAAVLEHLDVKRVHAGTVSVADARRVGALLASPSLQTSGHLEEDERWGLALRGLEALGVVATDPMTRVLHLDLGLERTLAGDTEDATDRLVHRLVDKDLHVLVPAIRAALAQAGEGAIDKMIFLEELRAQHRDVLFPPWLRDGEQVYPHGPGGTLVPYDDEGFERVEARMVGAVLRRMVRFGLIRRAAGVFAATPDGRHWSRALDRPQPPIWVSGDLEIIVPPGALTPWERFQVERMGRCLQRDVVDRYKLERPRLRTWLSTHDASEALALLRRRCPGVPAAVVETLEAWSESALRVVLTRGVLLPTGDEDRAAGQP